MSRATAPDPTLGLLFRQVRDAMWARMEQELAAAGQELNYTQFLTLKRLSEGTASATELARAAHLHPGAMTRLLDKLEQQGLVARVTDPDDRRALHVDLTAQGREQWAHIRGCGLRVQAQAVAGMSAADQARLIALLNRVRDNLSS